MGHKKHKTEFIALGAFLAGAAMVLTNGFSARIFAQEEDLSLFEQIEPIGDVLAEILKNYVYEADIDKAVEGALVGIMSSLDRNSRYIPPINYQRMREDTEGSFEGIGVRIDSDDDGNVVIVQPMPNAPAAKVGLQSGDIIFKIDDEDAVGISTTEAVSRIKGPRGEFVKITVMRFNSDTEGYDELDFDVKRGRIPVESIIEARVLDGGIGYIRISDFKKNTAKEIKEKIGDFEKEGLNAFILDLRWNPGGLLTSAKEVCALFLEKNTLVTYTRGKDMGDGKFLQSDRLYTNRAPIIPATMPILLLVNETSASSSEIVTGALQFHERAIIIGEKTFGKGSVQTIISLDRPKNSALALTTALYYTPAEVTINKVGILPDVHVEMDIETQRNLLDQLRASMGKDLSDRDAQNHGAASGDTDPEEDSEVLVEDLSLQRAVSIINEDSVFSNLMERYHRSISETQVEQTDQAKAAEAAGDH
jgi:carboxyl-terminal processing protease